MAVAGRKGPPQGGHGAFDVSVRSNFERTLLHKGQIKVGMP
jgi:hypothetical protein